MKRSTWIIVVGVLAILIGINGMVQGLASLASTIHQAIEQSEVISGREVTDPAESSEETFSHRSAQSLHESSQKYDPPVSDQAFEVLGRLLADNNPWGTFRSVVYLLIAGAYLIAGIVLIFKPYGSRIFLRVMAASISWSLMQMVFYSHAEMEMLFVVAPVFGPSVVIDVILAVIVWAATRVQPLKETGNEDRSRSMDRGFRMDRLMNVLVPKITGISAGIFALIFPFWILGVPGVNNTFAQGWRMGLDVLMYYPIAWVTVFGISWLLKTVIPLDRQAVLNALVSICLFVFFSIALLRIGQALRLIAT